MAYSTQRAVSNGTLGQLALSIEYFDRSEITVSFNDVLSPLSEGEWSWVGTTDQTIKFTPNVPNGVEVLVRRNTKLDDPIHQFGLGAQFLAGTLDENFRQVLRVAQDAKEGSGNGDVFRVTDHHGYRIKNIGPAVDAGDAVSLGQYQADAEGAKVARTKAEAAAAKLGYVDSAVLALAEMAATTEEALGVIAQKLAEGVSVKDHGAKGDGVTDDTAAFTAARAASGGAYFIPDGVYVLSPTPNVFLDNFKAAGNVTLSVGGTNYPVSNAFAGRLRYRVASPVLTWLTDAVTGNDLMGFQNGNGGTATYMYRTLSINCDSHFLQAAPGTHNGSTDMLFQRSAVHPTDPAGNRFNFTFEESNDRMLFNYATAASGSPVFDSYMRVVAGTTPVFDFPALAPCFRMGWSMQNRAETGYKLAWAVGADRHHIKDAAGTFTHMTFKQDGSVGFFGAGGVTRPTVSGSRSSGAALTSLLTALSQLGLITDATTA